MTKKAIPILALLIVSSLLIAFPAFAQDKKDDLYVIKKGDTLWDLSDQFLDDPYDWPELWQRNQYITNPHLIYPGNSLRLHGKPEGVRRAERREGVVTEAQPIVEAEEAAGIEEVIEESVAAEAEEGVTPSEALPGKGDEVVQVLRKGRVEFVILDDESVGIIVDGRYRKRLLAHGDTVYIAMKEKAPEVGERFLVFRTTKTLQNPYTKEKTKKIYVLGALTVTAAKGVLYQAEITHSLDAIWRGDEIMTYRTLE